MIRIPPGGTDLARYLPFLDRIAEMEARHINVVFDDSDRGRNVDAFARICELAAARGLTADLEFMPWTGVKTLAEARAVVEGAGHPAGAILFDCLHFDRCGATLAEIDALPPGAINYVQLCDGPEAWEVSDEALVRVARTARLVPGEGGIDLPAILRRLPPGLPVSVEVPNHEEAARTGATALARRALAASKAMIADLETDR
jgi:sugar phosphate isomerase/epimerase